MEVNLGLNVKNLNDILALRYPPYCFMSGSRGANMDIFKKVYKEFKNYGGILSTAQLNKQGLSSRQIRRLVENKSIIRIKRGFYELPNIVYPEEITIARLFPKAVIFLESALVQYGYTDRMPSAWQIAVDKNSEKSIYNIKYPAIKVYYLKAELLEIGLDKISVEGINIKIFNRDRTICDILRYENKLEKEVFNSSIQRYIEDPKKNIVKLIEYAEKLNIKNKMQRLIGVWL